MADKCKRCETKDAMRDLPFCTECTVAMRSYSREKRSDNGVFFSQHVIIQGKEYIAHCAYEFEVKEGGFEIVPKTDGLLLIAQ